MSIITIILEFCLADILWIFIKDSIIHNIKSICVCGLTDTEDELTILLADKYKVPRLMKGKSVSRRNIVAGFYKPGDDCIIMDDILMNDSRILEAATVFRSKQLNVTQALVLIDTEQSSQKNLENQGIKVTSMYTITTLVKYLAEAGKIKHKIAETSELLYRVESRDAKYYGKINKVD